MDRLTALADGVAQHVPGVGMFDTEVPGLALIRADEPSAPTPAVYEPSVCLIAQGSKRVHVGSHSVLYDASAYLLVSVDLPVVGHILEASPHEPYLCCKVSLPRPLLAELVLELDERPASPPGPAVAVAPSCPNLLDAVCRMVALLDQPESIRVLAPLFQREIAYRLLAGPRGELLHRMAAGDGHLGQISRAVEYIRGGFRDALRVDDVAAAAGMSASSLHQHFKAVTSLTPLEYQKQLRLHEARRLMLAEGATASGAGFAVGYESPSQFSREYRRLFGAPPRQDIARMS